MIQLAYRLRQTMSTPCRAGASLYWCIAQQWYDVTAAVPQMTWISMSGISGSRHLSGRQYARPALSPTKQTFARAVCLNGFQMAGQGTCQV